MRGPHLTNLIISCFVNMPVVGYTYLNNMNVARVRITTDVLSAVHVITIITPLLWFDAAHPRGKNGEISFPTSVWIARNNYCDLYCYKSRSLPTTDRWIISPAVMCARERRPGFHDGRRYGPVNQTYCGRTRPEYWSVRLNRIERFTLKKINLENSLQEYKQNMIT